MMTIAVRTACSLIG